MWRDLVISQTPSRERLFEAARRGGALAPGTDPGLAAIALLALIDRLLRLCTQGDCSEGLMAAVAPAVDALLTGLRKT